MAPSSQTDGLAVTNRGRPSLLGLWMDDSPAVSSTVAEELHHAYYNRLVAMLTRLTGDRGRAEELASDVLCRLLSRPHLLRAGENVEGWLFRTAMNIGLDQIKMQARRLRYERAAVVEAVRTSAAVDPLDSLLRGERQRRVRTVLALLPARDAQLLMLRHMDCSYEEIARITNIVPSSIGKLLARALARFEKEYRHAFGGRP